MLLFKGLIRHVLGSDFNFQANLNMVRGSQNLFKQDSEKMNARIGLNQYYKILSLFMDNELDGMRSPFGIHNIAREGLKFKRRPGDWYGPQAISNVLHQINK